MDNLQEYQDAPLYEAEYGHFTTDIPYFHELSLSYPGDILDLACGTGRLTIPLYRPDTKVVGLDLCQKMLTLAQQKAANLPITWHQKDCRSFQLNQKFSTIIMAGNSFQAFLTPKDQIDMLMCVRHHLNSDGVFAFNTRNPEWEPLPLHGEIEYWHSFVDRGGENVDVHGSCTYDPLSQIARYKTVRSWSFKKTETLLDLRYSTCDQILKLMEDVGLKVTHIYGDFDKTPWNPSSPRMIFECILSF